MTLLESTAAKNNELDRNELRRLPAYNSFLKKHSVPTLEHTVVQSFPEPVWSSNVVTQAKAKDAETLRREILEMSEKRKRDFLEVSVSLQQSKEAKDKKTQQAVPAKKVVKPGDEVEESPASKVPEFAENAKIVFEESAKEVPGHPTYYPEVSFRLMAGLLPIRSEGAGARRVHAPRELSEVEGGTGRAQGLE